MAEVSIDTLMQQTARLLAIPKVVGEVMRLLDDPNSRPAEIGRLLAQDPALVAIVLRLANSPAFAPARTVDSMDRALVLLGRDHLRRLVIAGAVAQASTRLPTQTQLPLELFWRHSSYCAVIARLLAESAAPELAGTAFLGGLLHDLGRLILFSQVPEAAHAAFLKSLSDLDEMSPEAAEREELGFDHAELGAAFAEHWSLPDSLCACLRYHCDPLDAPDDFLMPVALVHIANSAAHLAELDSRDWLDAPPIEPEVLDQVKIDLEAVTALIDQAQYEVLEIEALRNPPPDNDKPAAARRR